MKDHEVGGRYLTKNAVKYTENALFKVAISEIGQWAFVAGPAGSSSMIGFNAIDSRGVFNPSVTATVNVAAAPVADVCRTLPLRQILFYPLSPCMNLAHVSLA